MPERSVKLARDFRLSRTVTKSKLQFTEKKNGGHLKRGGTLQCPPVRSGRPLTLRTEAGLVGEEQTNRPGARAVRTHLLRRFISAIIQTSKIFICTRRRSDYTRRRRIRKSHGISAIRWYRAQSFGTLPRKHDVWT